MEQAHIPQLHHLIMYTYSSPIFLGISLVTLINRFSPNQLLLKVILQLFSMDSLLF